MKTSRKLEKNKKNTDFVKKIQKRDGSIIAFDIEKIVNAVYKAMIASEEGSEKDARFVAHKVFMDLVKISKLYSKLAQALFGCIKLLSSIPASFVFIILFASAPPSVADVMP